MKCGNCKDNHANVAEVRNCYFSETLDLGPSEVTDLIQVERYDAYGNYEVSNIEDADPRVKRDFIKGNSLRTIPLSQVHEVVRLRLIGDWSIKRWDVSYCYGYTKNGEPVRVSVPVINWKGSTLKAARFAVMEMCKREKIYGKGIGILDAISFLMTPR